MAYTQEQYNKLKEAISSGALRVRYADKEVEYRSLSEMRTTLSMMEAELFPKSKPKTKFVTFTKDVD